jgi:uncharacterized cupredoxin-like copper-binding protein
MYTLEEVASYLNYPVALAFGPDGALYAAAPALGSIDPDGYILRIDVSSRPPIDVRDVAANAGGRDLGPSHTDHFGGQQPGTAGAAQAASTATPPPAATTSAATAAADVASSGEPVSLEAGNFYFDPNAVTIPAATPVTFAIKNVAQIPHNFSIDALKISVALPPGETTQVTITAPAGSYQFYCNLPGHRSAGMIGTLTAR